MNESAVVFGVDFSPIMRRAIPWVREFIAPLQPIVLVHAIDAPPLPGFLRRLIPASVAADEVCPQILARLQILANRAGAPDAERVTRPGRADRVLLDVANERGASLLAIGPHGIPAPPWRRIGTTAERLLRAAERSVLVVNGKMQGPPKRMLVALDDAAITPCVLSFAGVLADAHEAELHGVHVLSPASYNHLLSAEASGGGTDADILARIEQDMADETLRWLKSLWANASHHARLKADVLHGDPADEILRAARELPADLIVMGRYGVGRVVPAVLGSVVGSVVAGADCPVLVVGS
jgi:nucleotide-binding universal stress UspA family protein